MWHRRPHVSQQMHAQSRDLSSRYRTVTPGSMQQHLRAQGKLSSLLRLCTTRWADLWKRRQCLQVYVSNEAAHLRVRDLT